MTRSVAALALACMLPLMAGCDTQSGLGSGPGIQFIAANSSTVIVDMTPNSAPELEQARAMATQKCVLFGNTSAVLESLNVIASNRERASFLCR